MYFLIPELPIESKSEQAYQSGVIEVSEFDIVANEDDINLIAAEGAEQRQAHWNN